MKTTPGLHVVWLKRDLRLRDHHPLARAARQGTVVPLYIIQPGLLRGADSDARHWEFIRASLLELRENLRRRGCALVVREGPPAGVLHEIHRRHRIAALYSHRETGNLASYAADQAVARWAAEHGIPWFESDQNGVIRRLRSRRGWAAKWEARMAGPEAPPVEFPHPPHPLEPGEIPAADTLGMPSLGGAGFQEGGERAAWATLGSFLDRRAAGYARGLSSPLTACESCSRLSPHLAWGTISLRCVVQTTRARIRELQGLPGRQSEHGMRPGPLGVFLSRLHWHCHFMQKLEDFPEMEIRSLWPFADPLRSADPDNPLLAAWREGRTGYPFLDACLRAVRATGWMNFRMRAMMMSFAAYDLGLHWREPGLHLARCFLDYEPGIHWPQTQMQSGATGINTLRIYDPVKQGLEHDPRGLFTRRWVPELARVPAAFIHQPWRMSPLEHAACGLVPGRTYPARIVLHSEAAATAKARLHALRQLPEARAAADRIQEKHGSRKSGLPTSSRRRKTTPPDNQPLLL